MKIVSYWAAFMAVVLLCLFLIGCGYPPQGRDYFEASIASQNPVTGAPIKAQLIIDRTSLLTAYGERATTASLSLNADGTATVSGGHQVTKNTVNSLGLSLISGAAGFAMGLMGL